MTATGRIGGLVGIELAKMARQRLALAVVGIPTLAAVLVPQALRASGLERAQGFLALTRTIELALLLASFLLFLHAAVAIAWERSEKTLRDVLAGPARRWEVLFSRWIALETETLLVVGLVCAASLASTALRYGFEDIRGEAIEPLFYAGELVHHAALGIAYYAPAAMALVTAGLLVSVVSASPAVAAALGLGGLLVFDVAKSVFSGASGVSRWLLNAYLPTFFDQTSYLHGVAEMARGIGDVLWADDAPERGLGFAVPAIYAVGCLGLSLGLFARRDFAE